MCEKQRKFWAKVNLVFYIAMSVAQPLMGAAEPHCEGLSCRLDLGRPDVAAPGGVRTPVSPLCSKTETPAAKEFLEIHTLVASHHPKEPVPHSYSGGVGHGGVYYTDEVNTSKNIYDLKETDGPNGEFGAVTSEILRCVREQAEPSWLETHFIEEVLMKAVPNRIAQIDESYSKKVGWFGHTPDIRKLKRPATFKVMEQINLVRAMTEQLKELTAIARKATKENKAQELALLEGVEEQLREYWLAMKFKREPKITPKLKKLAIELGQKMNDPKHTKQKTEGENKFLGMLFTDPSAMDKAWGTYLGSAYRDLILNGEPKFAEKSKAIYRIDIAKAPLSEAQKNMALRHLNPKESSYFKLRHTGEDELFWKNMEHPFRATVLGMTPLQKQTLRNWALDGIAAMNDGKVASHDPLLKETLLQIARLVDAEKIDTKNESGESKTYAKTTDYLKYAPSLFGEVGLKKNDQYKTDLEQVDQLAKLAQEKFKITMPAPQRWAALSMSRMSRLALISMVLAATTKSEKEEVIALLSKESPAVNANTRMVLAARKEPKLMGSLIGELESELNKAEFSKGLALAKQKDLATLIRLLRDHDTNNNVEVQRLTHELRPLLVGRMTAIQKESAKDPRRAKVADAAAMLLNLADEKNRVDSHVRLLDGKAGQVNHYSAEITITAHETERQILKQIFDQMKAEGKGAKPRWNTQNEMEAELNSLITELHGPGVAVPTTARVQLAALLLPEHREHLMMLRRIKDIAKLRDSNVKDPKYRQAGKLFRDVLMNLSETPEGEEKTGINIERTLQLLNPVAFAYFTGEAQRDRLRKNVSDQLLGDLPKVEAMVKELEKTEGAKDFKKLDVQILKELALLTLVESERISPPVSTIYSHEKAVETLSSKPQIYGQMVAVLKGLARDTAEKLQRGVKEPAMAKLNPSQINELSAKLYMLAADGTVANLKPEEQAQVVQVIQERNQIGAQISKQIRSFNLSHYNPVTRIDDSALRASMENYFGAETNKHKKAVMDAARVYTDTLRQLEEISTEHRVVGEAKWDKEVLEATEDRNKRTEEQEKVLRNRRFWAEDRVRKIMGLSKNQDSERRNYEEAEKKRAAQSELLNSWLDAIRNGKLSKGERVHEYSKTIDEKLIPALKTKLMEYLRPIFDSHSTKIGETDRLRLLVDAFMVAQAVDPVFKAQRRASFISLADKLKLNGRALLNEVETKMGAEYRRAVTENQKNYVSQTIKEMGGDTIPKNFRREIELGITKFLNARDELTAENIYAGEMVDIEATEFVDRTYGAQLDKIKDDSEYTAQRERLKKIAKLQISGAAETDQKNENLARAALEVLDKDRKDIASEVDAMSTTNLNASHFKPLIDSLRHEATSGENAALKMSDKDFDNYFKRVVDRKKTQMEAETKQIERSMAYLGTLGFKYNGVEMILDDNTRLDVALAGNGSNGRSHLWDALETVNRVIPLTIATSSADPMSSKNGKKAVMGLIEENYFDRSNEGGQWMPVNDYTAVKANLDADGKIAFTVGNNPHMSAELKVCIDKAKASRDDHQKAAEEYGGFWSSTSTVFANTANYGQGEWWDSRGTERNLDGAWNKYMRAVNECLGYGHIETAKDENGKAGESGVNFVRNENKYFKQLQLNRSVEAVKRFDEGVSFWRDAGIELGILIGTMGFSSALQGAAAAGKAALIAESYRGLRLGEKAVFWAAKSGRARTMIVRGVEAAEKANILNREAQLARNSSSFFGKYFAGTKMFFEAGRSAGASTSGKHALMSFFKGGAHHSSARGISNTFMRSGVFLGAAPNLVGYVGMGGYDWYQQSSAYEKAETLYRSKKFVRPERGDFKTDTEFQIATKEFEDLKTRADRNDNGIPDSMDGFGTISTNLHAMDILRSTNTSMQFMLGMAYGGQMAHLAKLPLHIYWVPFVGSTASHMGDLVDGKKTMGEVLAEASITTIGFAPGMAFMNSKVVANTIFKIPLMNTTVNTLAFRSPLGHYAAAGVLHKLNHYGDEVTRKAFGELGLIKPVEEVKQIGPKSRAEQLSELPSMLFSAFFAMDMTRSVNANGARSKILTQMPKTFKAPVQEHSKTEPLKSDGPKTGEALVENRTQEELRNEGQPNIAAAEITPEGPVVTGNTAASKPVKGPKTFSLAEIEKIHGHEAANQALWSLTPKEVYEHPNEEVQERLAQQSGLSRDMMLQYLDVHLNGKDAKLIKHFDMEWKDDVTPKGNTFLGKTWQGLHDFDGANKTMGGAFSEIRENLNRKFQEAFLGTKNLGMKQELLGFFQMHPDMVASMEARNFNFNYEDGVPNRSQLIEFQAMYEYAKLAKQQLNPALDPMLQLEIPDGEMAWDYYSLKFVDFVKNRVEAGRAQERSLEDMIELYNDAWFRGELNDLETPDQNQVEARPSVALRGSEPLLDTTAQARKFREDADALGPSNEPRDPREGRDYPNPDGPYRPQSATIIPSIGGGRGSNGKVTTGTQKTKAPKTGNKSADNFMIREKWTDNTVFYGVMDRQNVISDPNGLRVEGSPSSNPLRIKDIYNKGKYVQAQTLGPSLSVSSSKENFPNSSIGADKVVVQIKLTDLLKMGSLPYPEVDGDGYLFTVPQGQGVPVTVSTSQKTVAKRSQPNPQTRAEWEASQDARDGGWTNGPQDPRSSRD